MEHLALHAGGEGVLALLPRVLGRRVRGNPRTFSGLLLYGTLGRSGNTLQSLGRAVKLQYQMLALYDCLVRVICSKYLSTVNPNMFWINWAQCTKYLSLKHIVYLNNSFEHICVSNYHHTPLLMTFVYGNTFNHQLSLGAGGVMFVFSLHNNSKLLQLNYIKVLRR